MNSDLQQKLHQYSAEPPEGVWNKITDALDEEGSFAPRLYQYEAAPPAGIWEKVDAALSSPATESTTKAPVVPFTKRFSKPFRYAAVASLIAAVLIIFTLTSDRTEAGAIDSQSSTTVPASNEPITAGTNQTTGTATEAQSGKPGGAARSSRSPSGEERPDAGTNTADDGSTASLHNYVTYSDSEGKVMKVSRKVAGYLQCKDEDLTCKKRLKELQQKMAASALTSDFTGVLDMLRQLQQKP